MLSIIIPTLNEESVLEGTLKRLRLEFTSMPYEIIVSDESSTDRTGEIARAHADRVIVQPPPKTNIAAGRNRGAAAATGSHLVFLDADMTIPNPNAFFARALADFERDPRLVGLTVNIRVLPEHETTADWIVFGLVNAVHRLKNNALGIGSASGEFQMVKMSAWKEVGGYNEQLGVTEDLEFFWRLRRVGNTRFDPSLTILHTGRRAHRIGWPRLLWDWGKNYLSVVLFKRSANKDWKVIR